MRRVGRASAMVTIINAKMALARLTNDSIASDNKPTESVTQQAKVFSVMVVTATATEAQSNRFGVRKRTGGDDIMGQ